jgi:hypothetical protein
VLTRDGVTFKSRRADENTEFVRSRDNWFRPVNFVNAPDGTLTVLDMYRETIEHPWSIPDDIKTQLDLSSGKERGRLYRLRPPEFANSKPPKISTATTAELVAHLESPHSWYRESAQRLIFERQDKTAIEPLRRLLTVSNSPQARLHALHLLAAFSALTDDELQHGLHDAEMAIRVHSVRLAEPAIRDYGARNADRRALKSHATVDAVFALSGDSDAAVRFQVALSMGDATPEIAMSALYRIASRDADDPWMRAAILSSAQPVADKLAVIFLDHRHSDAFPRTNRTTLLRELATIIGAEGKPPAIDKLLAALTICSERDLVYASLSGLGQGLARRREKLSDWIAHLPAEAREPIERQIAQATSQASNPEATVPARTAAIQLLGYLAWADVHPSLVACVAPTEPREVQQTSLRILGTFNEPEVASELLRRWKQFTPPLRDEAVTVLLSRPIWNEPLVAALETGDIPIAQVSIPQRGRLAEIIGMGLRLRQWVGSCALTQEIIGFLARCPRPQEIVAFPPSETAVERSQESTLNHAMEARMKCFPDCLDIAQAFNDAPSGNRAPAPRARLAARRPSRS